MTTLRIGKFQMPAAALGPENPLPPLRPTRNVSSAELAHAPKPVEYPDRGGENIVLPYRTLDGYTRERKPRDFHMTVLENDKLRATFTLELGGRLWSLFDKTAGKELLSVNPVFQPCNFAVRNAWSSGGVEWNLGAGLLGHHVLTVEPLFAARLTADDGSPVLRVYEWERGRGIAYQMDFSLPNDSPFLFVRVRLTNPNPYIVPIYWWTNIAAQEKEGARVLAPATSGQRHDYSTGALFRLDVPMVKGVDESYTTNSKDASDLYFDIPKGHRPWIGWLDTDGSGLIHASTDRLPGRKLFNWGQGRGSQHWQDFLADSQTRYLEIQAGLAQTQSEFVPMPAGAVWEWAEALGPIHVPPEKGHGEWNSAVAAMESTLESMLPRKRLEEILQSGRSLADKAPDEVIHLGRGWAALENHRRKAAGEKLLPSTGTPYSEKSLGDDQKPWLHLLEKGELPYRPAADDPGALMVQKEWQTLLDAAVKAGRGAHWLSWYYLGLMRYRQGDNAGAKAAWQTSVAAEPSAWAYRNLAELAREEKDDSAAVDLLLKAIRLAPKLKHLAVECAEAIGASGRVSDVPRILELADPTIHNDPRLRMLIAKAALDQGDLAPADEFFKQTKVVNTLRENELSISDLWYSWQTQRYAKKNGVKATPELKTKLMAELSPPVEYEFRMRGASS